MSDDANNRCNTILILGLGNTLLADDGIGPAVARRLHARLPAGTADLLEASAGGLEALELMAGYDRVVLIDAIRDPAGTTGELQVGRLIDILLLGTGHIAPANAANVAAVRY